MNWFLIVALLIAYIVGARWPGLAQTIGAA
jgi:hypothetical protein